MEALPNDLFALSLLVFILGLKHGFDADHLATIDGLTRFNSRANPRLARFCGALFSLGHGAVVVAIALAVSAFARRWQTPEWLELFGAWVSIAFLATLGLINIHAVLRTDPAQVVRPVGLKGRFLGRLTTAASPGLVALVGALFALSFDTISQTALFAVTATQFGGWRDALMLGLLFMLGMLVTDGVNGLWISRLICRADQLALIASRVMSLVVAGVSLLVAAFGVVKLALPSIAAWSEGKEMFFGGAVVALVAGSFLLALWLTRTVSPATVSSGD
ncbi:nickel/cobalt efflux system [Sulfurimicrobium lacus]|uniref:Nickel/cobalt efflux system n=1 Tax=Sulfurimicrobium lacus TaxID=2715678 RepID=A0A6F8V8C0_9PROT|nr:nickel transporter [Sulfurimicrobium lacus]BCB26083.1 nickel/cobalt efflux system [Sulfurimicrobium lacus]